jgi:hypothetical protein
VLQLVQFAERDFDHDAAAAPNRENVNPPAALPVLGADPVRAAEKPGLRNALDVRQMMAIGTREPTAPAVAIPAPWLAAGRHKLIMLHLRELRERRGHHRHGRGMAIAAGTAEVQGKWISMRLQDGQQDDQQSNQFRCSPDGVRRTGITASSFLMADFVRNSPECGAPLSSSSASFTVV